MQFANANDLCVGDCGAGAGMSAAVACADSLTVKTEQGKVQGKTINDGKVRAFLGLPYAAPPVGELRWKAPAAAGEMEGRARCDAIRRALRAGPVSSTTWSFRIAGPSEDCLYPERLYACRRQGQQQAAGDVLDSWRRVFGRRGSRAAPQRRLSAHQRAWCWSRSTTGLAFSDFWRPQIWQKKAMARQGTTG